MMMYTHDKCHRCPKGTYNDGTWDKCKECHGIVDLDRKRCTEVEKHCPAGKGHTRHSHEICEPCIDNTWNDGYFKYCKSCNGHVDIAHTGCTRNNLRN
jgi:hypothetical protein